MPSIEEIAQFKQVLNELGAEPRILAERSETIEDIEPPEEGLSDDLRQLLSGAHVEGDAGLAIDAWPTGGEDAPSAIEPEAALPDLDFASLFGEPPGGEAPDPGADIPDEDATGASAPDADILDEEPEGEAAEEESTAAEEALPEEFDLLDMVESDLPGFAGAVDPEGADAEAGAPEDPALGGGVPGEALTQAGEEPLPPLEDFTMEGLPEEFTLPAEGDFELPDSVDFTAAESAEPPEAREPAAGPESTEPAESAAKGETALPPFVEEIRMDEGGTLAADTLAADSLAADGGDEGSGAAPEKFTLDEIGFPPGEETAGPATEDEAVDLFPGPDAEQGRPETPVAGKELQLSEQDFSRLQRTLDSLPRNLKIAIEELIAEKGLSGEGLHALVGRLVEGAPPSTIARQFNRITGQRIILPSGFEKKTGLAFEAERHSFGYAFRRNILPILGRFLLGAALLSVLAYAGYHFIYQPVHAVTLYGQGYKLLREGSYPSANRSFDRATQVYPMRRQYFRYADGFIQARQYSLAEEKYEQLLRRYGDFDRQGLLAYARLEVNYLADYPKAVDFLDTLIGGKRRADGTVAFKGNFRDYDALLLRGDTYLAWAEEKSEYYEKARFDYAQLLDYHGQHEEVLFRMLRYFIRTDQLEETKRLKALLESRRGLKVDAPAYAELGGYLFDRQQFDLVERTLMLAFQADRELPEVNYQLARWYGKLRDPAKEEQALRSVLGRLKEVGAMTRRQQVMQIDTHTRLGRLFWARRQYLDAVNELGEAIRRIESGQKLAGLGEDPLFGEAYRGLGDIFYYIDRNWDNALTQYQKALENRLDDSGMVYRMGVIDYLGGRFEQALPRFAEAAERLSGEGNPNVLYALANTLSQLGHYFSAEGYYLQLLSMLEVQRGRIRSLQPEINPEHRALVDNTMRVYNNLGVTLGRLMEQSGDRRLYARALANLTFSSEYFDVLRRDPATLARGDTKNLAYLNQRGMLYPQPAFELQLYNPLPLDTVAADFSGETERR